MISGPQKTREVRLDPENGQGGDVVSRSADQGPSYGWDDYAYFCRTQATRVLVRLWRRQATAHELAVLRLVPTSVFRARGPIACREALEYLLVHARQATTKGHTIHVWMDALLVISGPSPMTRQEIDEFASAAQQRLRFEPQPPAYTQGIWNDRESLHDCIDRLVLRAGEAASDGDVGTDASRSLTISCSFEQLVLVELVATNRGETTDSILREAVSLLIDAGDAIQQPDADEERGAAHAG